MPHFRVGVTLVLLVCFVSHAQGQPTAHEEEALSRLQGVSVRFVSTGSLEKSEAEKKIADALKENVVVPALERAGIKMYSRQDLKSTKSSPELRIKFAAIPKQNTYMLTSLEIRQDVFTRGGSKHRTDTYMLYYSSGGMSSVLYPPLSEELTEAMELFIQDWRAAH